MVKSSLFLSTTNLRIQSLQGLLGTLLLLLALIFVTGCQGDSGGSSAGGDPNTPELPVQKEVTEPGVTVDQGSFDGISDSLPINRIIASQIRSVGDLDLTMPTKAVNKLAGVVEDIVDASLSSSTPALPLTAYSSKDVNVVELLKSSVTETPIIPQGSVMFKDGTKGSTFYFTDDKSLCSSKPTSSATCDSGSVVGRYVVFPFGVGIHITKDTEKEPAVSLVLGGALSSDTGLVSNVDQFKFNPYSSSGYRREKDATTSPDVHDNFNIVFTTKGHDSVAKTLALTVDSWKLTDTIASNTLTLKPGANLDFKLDVSTGENEGTGRVFASQFNLDIGSRYSSSELTRGNLAGQFFGLSSSLYASGIYSFETKENEKTMEYWGIFINQGKK